MLKKGGTRLQRDRQRDRLEIGGKQKRGGLKKFGWFGKAVDRAARGTTVR